MDKTLSVVIPAYNEADVIVATLQKTSEFLAGRYPGSEVLVVDDGSIDETVSLVEGSASGCRGVEVRCLRQQVNKGKGSAVRMGVLEARRPYVLFSDADLSTPIEDVDDLFLALESGADIAIGSRAVDGARIEIRQPFYRSLMGKVFNRIMRAITRVGVADSQCGFKLFSRAAARAVFERCRVDGFAFDVEALWLARELGYRVDEIPVRWRNRAESRVHPIYHSAEMLRDVIKMRWMHRR